MVQSANYLTVGYGGFLVIGIFRFDPELAFLSEAFDYLAVFVFKLELADWLGKVNFVKG